MTAPPARAVTRAEADGLLRAGALLPLDADVSAEPLSARVHRHPALGDRPIVRLVPDAIGEADDLALQTLDFGLVEVRGPVALGRPRGLGFPASAILADPANAGYALSVVKEMERFARMAKSKPGNARDGFEAIAQRLARTVPHFLPSFHEQAGRAFLEAGAAAQAAGQFARAREAERTYGLPVDERERRQSFLEFALAGALTAKSLSEYARELIRAQEPAQAHAALKELCIQRTLGGLPPWTAMAAELRRTARAAGLDPGAEEAEVLRELLDAPATTKAAAGFWRGYRAALVRLAKGDPAMRGVLLNLHPTPTEGAQDFVEWWLELLRESGAVDALIRPDGAPPEALPHGGAGPWLERTARQANAGYSWRRRPAPMARLLQLVGEIAPVVRRGGQAVQLWTGYSVDVDLLDAALAAGIDVAQPESTGPYAPVVDLRSYAARGERRPLLALGVAPEFAAMVDRSIAVAILEHADKLAELPGLHDALRRWLQRQAERCTTGTLVTLIDAVAQLSSGATAAVRALDPEAALAIARADVAGILARSLRGGLLAEVGWPALEGARIDLDVAHVAGFAWPELLVADARRVVLVGPDATRLEHDLRIPPNTADWARSRMVVANDQIFVGWRGREREGYWTGRPADVFEPAEELLPSWRALNPGAQTSLRLEDGGRFEGGPPIHAGDTTATTPRKVVSDGVTTWVMADDGSSLREVDPATGRTGRASLPAFFEDFAAEGWTLDLRASWLMPLPAGADASLIGTDGRLIGFRVRRRTLDGTTEWEIEGVDGRRFRGALDDRRGPADPIVPQALIRLPGDPAPRPVAAYAHSTGIVAWDAEGRDPLLRATWGGTAAPVAGFAPFGTPEDPASRLLTGTRFVPPPLYWFALVPREPAASTALRSIGDAAAARLLEAAQRELPADGDASDDRATATVELAVAAAIPQVRDERIRAGVAAAALVAAGLARRLGAFDTDAERRGASRGRRAEAGTADLDATMVVRVIDDRALGVALEGLVSGDRPSYMFGGDGGRPLEQMAAVAAAMDRSTGRRGIRALLPARPPARETTLPTAWAPWYLVLGRLGAVALRAALATTPEDVRITLVAFLEAMVTHQYASRSADVRLLAVSRRSQQGPAGAPLVTLEWSGDRTLFVGGSRYWSGEAQATGFEYAPGGRFALGKDLALLAEERRGAGWGEDGRVRRFVARLAERGPVPWDPSAVGRLQDATGLSRAAAALLLATLPSIDSYEHNFLPAATRGTLGIKATEARAARDQLKILDMSERLGLLDAAMPPDPDELWDAGLGPVAERLAAAWVRLRGRRVVIDDDLLAAASRQLAFRGSPPDPLRLVADPSDRRLTHDPPVIVQAGWAADPRGDDVFSGAVLRSVAIMLPWLHAAVPVGDPLLGNLDRVLASVRGRLGSENLVLPLEWVSWPGQSDALRAMGARPWRPPRGATVSGTPLEVGPFLAVGSPQSETLRLYLRPAALGPSLPEPLLELLSADALALVQSAVYLLGPDSAAIVERAGASPLPPGGWEADPGQSAPELVTEVTRELGVPPEAAQLFLQVLALPAPTRAGVLRWNGWTGPRFTKAAQPLRDAGLVVIGQRPRAGRDLFLSGPWLDVATPDLPVEAWKLPLYGAGARPDGTVRKPLDRLLPLRPLPELFGAAWARWMAGDRPGFDQVRARR